MAKEGKTYSLGRKTTLDYDKQNEHAICIWK